MFRLFRTRMIVSFLLVTFALISCGPKLFGRSVTQELQVPRSDIRDVVLEAALWSDGQPIFERLDSNYAFDDSQFHIEGDFRGSDGQSQHGFLDLAFNAKQGDLEVSIVEHNIEGLVDDEIERVNDALSAELMQMIATTLDQEVVEYRDVESLAYNILQISLITKMDSDAMIVPLPSQ